MRDRHLSDDGQGERRQPKTDRRKPAATPTSAGNDGRVAGDVRPSESGSRPSDGESGSVHLSEPEMQSRGEQMSNTLRKYRVCGSQPVVVRGESIPPGETVAMTDEEASFKLAIGAVEPAPHAKGAEPFNTMADATEKKE